MSNQNILAFAPKPAMRATKSVDTGIVLLLAAATWWKAVCAGRGTVFGFRCN